MQRAFSKRMAETGDHAYSAEKAGYAVPVIAGGKLMKVPDVAEDVRRRARQRLMTEGAEVSVNVLIEIATDSGQKGSSRVAAAGKLGQMSGIASAQNLSEADLAEMPPDKIRELLAQAQRALLSRMKTVQGRDAEPVEIESAQGATVEVEPESPDCAQDAPNPFD